MVSRAWLSVGAERETKAAIEQETVTAGSDATRVQ